VQRPGPALEVGVGLRHARPSQLRWLQVLLPVGLHAAGTRQDAVDAHWYVGLPHCGGGQRRTNIAAYQTGRDQREQARLATCTRSSEGCHILPDEEDDRRQTTEGGVVWRKGPLRILGIARLTVPCRRNYQPAIRASQRH